MITAACWNVRGLNLAHRQDEVKALVSLHNISVIGLLETKVRSPKHLLLARNLLPGWKFFYNYSHHRLGRIWVAWNPDVLSVSPLVFSAQLIHLSIRVIATDQDFWTSFVYGFNDERDRESLWQSIQSIARSRQHEPWVVLGDFNIVRFSHEKIGGNLTSTTAMATFNDCCFDSDLDDLPFTGHALTWSNKSPGHRHISRKLDRALANPSWSAYFPNTEVSFEPPGVSDHCPIILRTGIPLPKLFKPFKFFNCWVDHPSFMGLVQETWQTDVQGFPLFRVATKLKLLKTKLKEFNRAHFSNINSRVADARHKLFEVQSQLQNSPSCPRLRLLEQSALQSLVNLLRADESIYRQKSRIQWLAEGDQNSSFFFHSVKQRQFRNKMVNLVSEDGRCIRGHANISNETVSFFKYLFNSQSATPYPGK